MIIPCGTQGCNPPQFCDGCEGEGIEVQQFPCFVNAFMVQQAFGGREEGGWWYDCGTPEESRKVYNQAELDSTLAFLRARYELTEDGVYLYKDQYDHPDFDRDRNSPHSATGSGYSYCVRVEDQIAEHWPLERPHYD